MRQCICKQCGRKFFENDGDPNIHYSIPAELCLHCESFNKLPDGEYYQAADGEYYKKGIPEAEQRNELGKGKSTPQYRVVGVILEMRHRPWCVTIEEEWNEGHCKVCGNERDGYDLLLSDDSNYCAVCYHEWVVLAGCLLIEEEE